MSTSTERTVTTAGLGWPDPEPSTSAGVGWPKDSEETR